MLVCRKKWQLRLSPELMFSASLWRPILYWREREKRKKERIASFPSLLSLGTVIEQHWGVAAAAALTRVDERSRVPHVKYRDSVAGSESAGLAHAHSLLTSCRLFFFLQIPPCCWEFGALSRNRLVFICPSFYAQKWWSRFCSRDVIELQLYLY